MTFDEVLAQMRELLQREGRVSYRALKRRFALDDDYLEDSRDELIKAERMAVDEAGEVLVWVGDAVASSPSSRCSVPIPAAELRRLRTSGLQTARPRPRCRRAAAADGDVL